MHMNIKNICDMHTHSVFSDGTYTPEEIIDSALKAGISAVALTDHNNVDGLPRFIDAAKGKNISAIPGAEFSVDYDGTELHLLGLFLPQNAFDDIAQLMHNSIMRKEKSNIELAATLTNAGFCINYDEIKAKTENGYVNRAHFAEAMVSAGYAKTMNEAFLKYLSKDAGFYKEPKRISVWEMLDTLKSIGAAPVLAHPFLQLTEQELREFLPKAKEFGLIGMECYYSLYDKETTELSLSLVEKFGLCPGGGSDFHGAKKPDIELGFGKGNLKIPLEWAENIKNNI